MNQSSWSSSWEDQKGSYLRLDLIKPFSKKFKNSTTKSILSHGMSALGVWLNARMNYASWMLDPEDELSGLVLFSTTMNSRTHDPTTHLQCDSDFLPLYDCFYNLEVSWPHERFCLPPLWAFKHLMETAAEGSTGELGQYFHKDHCPTAPNLIRLKTT